MSIYKLAILVAASSDERSILAASIVKVVVEFGLTVGNEVIDHGFDTLTGRDEYAAFDTACFGNPRCVELEAARLVALTSAPITGGLSRSGVGFRDAVSDGSVSSYTAAVHSRVGVEQLRTKTRYQPEARCGAEYPVQGWRLGNTIAQRRRGATFCAVATRRFSAW